MDNTKNYKALFHNLGTPLYNFMEISIEKASKHATSCIDSR